ncbi:MAG: MarR family transcriptional regulator [Xylophilus ampelinus]
MSAKSQDLPFVENYLPAMMNKASHLISAEFHQVAQAHGFSVTEWRVLACLHDGRGYNIGELSEAALTKQPTLTRLLARMESRGEVLRKDSPEDKRITLVRLTPKGTRVANKLVALAREHEERVLAELGFQSANDLKRALRQLAELHGESLKGSLEPSSDA